MIVREVRTEADRDLFLGLPGSLYRPQESMQDIGTERRILNGTHVLSAEARASAWLVTTETEKALARCMLIDYADDEAAYIGFFECVEDEAVCRLLLAGMEEEGRRLGKRFLRGPLNLSFWIGYRFKIDHFDRPFTSEPYNRPYYAPFWQSCGFTVADRYISNEYGQIPAAYFQTKHKKRLDRIRTQGYRISHPHWWNFGRSLRLIYRAISDLYSSFPGYRPISLPAFRKLFGGLRFVLDRDMVLLVQKDGEPVGFTVALPDYGNLLQQPLSVSFIKRLIRMRRKPKRYIVLYMGVYPQHVGLGSAMAELIKETLHLKKAESVGALIHEGKATGSYFRELQKDSRHYVWLEKPL
ncbi:MAG: hypothetical protein Q4D52_02495 [Eubacteriales bacterium]|nr:hypothetical protein [Eubacteriales bacterium]